MIVAFAIGWLTAGLVLSSLIMGAVFRAAEDREQYEWDDFTDRPHPSTPRHLSADDFMDDPRPASLLTVNTTGHGEPNR